ncbi:hypothetical protein DENSPDRAFT_146432 [Dentipellis sp. KUC8613]|nr:hypothetical protein DENSPDRAFT_146432 [Dentipellis sp. KUC8613]
MTTQEDLLQQRHMSRSHARQLNLAYPPSNVRSRWHDEERGAFARTFSVRHFVILLAGTTSNLSCAEIHVSNTKGAEATQRPIYVVILQLLLCTGELTNATREYLEETQCVSNASCQANQKTNGRTLSEHTLSSVMLGHMLVNVNLESWGRGG